MQRACVLMCLVMVMLSLCSLIAADWVPTVYTSRLDGFQAAPTVGSTYQIGIAVCVLDRNLNPMELDCEIAHTVSSNVSSIQIRKGLAGSFDGKPLYVFSSVAVQQRQVFQLNDIVTLIFNPLASNDDEVFTREVYSVTEQVDDFLNGRWFIDMWSTRYPSGELRGQLLHTHRLYSRMESDGVLTPTGFDSLAAGLMVAEYSQFHPRRREVRSTVVHSVANPTGVLVTGSPSLEYHQVLYQFSNFHSPITESYTVPTVRNEYDMFHEQHFMTITSVESTRIGEIRGEINVIDYLPPEEVGYTSRLSGSQMLPNFVSSGAHGCMIIRVDCASRLIEYLIVHTVSEPLAANIHTGFDDEVGPFLFPLARAASPIYGSRVLERSEFDLLVHGKLYVVIPSALHPTGEIRGQINSERNFYAYLTGTNLSPPVTTSGVGCATFQIFEERNQQYVLNYHINHNVRNPTDVTIEYGGEGTEGQGVLYQWSGDAVSSPITGDDEDFHQSTRNNWILGRYFLQIRSSDFPKGELRGNIYHVTPCVDSSPEAYVPDLNIPPVLPESSSSSTVDPLVIASFQVNNVTVHLRIGHIRGTASSLAPSMTFIVLCCIVLALFTRGVLRQ